MAVNGKSALGLLLVAVGGIVVLNILGIHISGLMKWILPIVFILLGIVGWKNNRKWLGGILVTVGAITLLGKLSGLLVLVLAIGVIVWGVSLFKGDRSYRGTYK